MDIAERLQWSDGRGGGMFNFYRLDQIRRTGLRKQPMSKRKSPPDMLAHIGRALYGEHWRLPLARGVGVDDDTIRRWMTGRTSLRGDHGVFIDALSLLRQRRRELSEAAKELDDWMLHVAVTQLKRQLSSE